MTDITRIEQAIILANYTPHTVTLYCDPEDAKRPMFSCGSVGVARVEESQETIALFNDYIPLRRTTFGEIVGLPEPRRNTVFIVSMVVAQANARATQPRGDLVCPDTGKSCLRDDRGQIIGVTGFVKY